LRLAVLGVERKVEIGVGAAEILTYAHNHDLVSAAGASRRDAVVHEGLLTDSVSVVGTYSSEGSRSTDLADPFAISPRLGLQEGGAEL
jgi:hypothetical protein